MPDSRQACFLALYVWILFVRYPCIESMDLREHLFCRDPQVDLPLRDGLRSLVSSPASLIPNKVEAQGIQGMSGFLKEEATLKFIHLQEFLLSFALGIYILLIFMLPQ